MDVEVSDTNEPPTEDTPADSFQMDDKDDAAENVNAMQPRSPPEFSEEEEGIQETRNSGILENADPEEKNMNENMMEDNSGDSFMMDENDDTPNDTSPGAEETGILAEFSEEEILETLNLWSPAAERNQTENRDGRERETRKKNQGYAPEGQKKNQGNAPEGRKRKLKYKNILGTGKVLDFDRCVFIGNIPYEVKTKELRATLRQRVGPVTHTEFFRNIDATSKGAALIEFKSKSEAHKAVYKMNGFKLQHRKLIVKRDPGGFHSRKYFQELEEQLKELEKPTTQSPEQPTPDPSNPSTDTGESSADAKRKRTESGDGGGGDGPKKIRGDDPDEEKKAPTYSNIPGSNKVVRYGHSIFVSNIPYDVEWKELRSLFNREVGRVTHVELFLHNDETSKGVALVEFQNKPSVEKAVTNMNGFELQSRKLLIKEDPDGCHSEEYFKELEEQVTAKKELNPQLPDAPNLNSTNPTDTMGASPANKRKLSASSDGGGGGKEKQKKKGEDDKNGEKKGPKIPGPNEVRQNAGSVYISNISYDVNWKDLKSLLQRRVGGVKHVEMLSNGDGTPKGSALVEFSNKENAKKAVDAMNGFEFQKRKMVVKQSPDVHHNEEKAKTEPSPQLLNKLNLHPDKVCNHVFVANLHQDVTKNKLKKVFQAAGRVNNVKLVEEDGRSKGRATVRFVNTTHAVNAVSIFNGQTLLERRMTVWMDKDAPRAAEGGGSGVPPCPLPPRVSRSARGPSFASSFGGGSSRDPGQGGGLQDPGPSNLPQGLGLDGLGQRLGTFGGFGEGPAGLNIFGRLAGQAILQRAGLGNPGLDNPASPSKVMHRMDMLRSSGLSQCLSPVDLGPGLGNLGQSGSDIFQGLRPVDVGPGLGNRGKSGGSDISQGLGPVDFGPGLANLGQSRSGISQGLGLADFGPGRSNLGPSGFPGPGDTEPTGGSSVASEATEFVEMATQQGRLIYPGLIVRARNTLPWQKILELADGQYKLAINLNELLWIECLQEFLVDFIPRKKIVKRYKHPDPEMNVQRREHIPEMLFYDPPSMLWNEENVRRNRLPVSFTQNEFWKSRASRVIAKPVAEQSGSDLMDFERALRGGSAADGSENAGEKETSGEKCPVQGCEIAFPYGGLISHLYSHMPKCLNLSPMENRKDKNRARLRITCLQFFAKVLTHSENLFHLMAWVRDRKESKKYKNFDWSLPEFVRDEMLLLSKQLSHLYQENEKKMISGDLCLEPMEDPATLIHWVSLGIIRNGFSDDDWSIFERKLELIADPARLTASLKRGAANLSDGMTKKTAEYVICPIKGCRFRTNEIMNHVYNHMPHCLNVTRTQRINPKDEKWFANRAELQVECLRFFAKKLTGSPNLLHLLAWVRKEVEGKGIVCTLNRSMRQEMRHLVQEMGWKVDGEAQKNMLEHVTSLLHWSNLLAMRNALSDDAWFELLSISKMTPEANLASGGGTSVAESTQEENGKSQGDLGPTSVPSSLESQSKLEEKNVQFVYSTGVKNQVPPQTKKHRWDSPPSSFPGSSVTVSQTLGLPTPLLGDRSQVSQKRDSKPLSGASVLVSLKPQASRRKEPQPVKEPQRVSYPVPQLGYRTSVLQTQPNLQRRDPQTSTAPTSLSGAGPTVSQSKRPQTVGPPTPLFQDNLSLSQNPQIREPQPVPAPISHSGASLAVQQAHLNPLCYQLQSLDTEGSSMGATKVVPPGGQSAQSRGLETVPSPRPFLGNHPAGMGLAVSRAQLMPPRHQFQPPSTENPQNKGPQSVPPSPPRLFFRAHLTVSHNSDSVLGEKQVRPVDSVSGTALGVSGRSSQALPVAYDTHFNLHLLEKQTRKKGLEAINAVARRAPQVPVKIYGGVVSYSDPATYEHIRFLDDPNFQVAIGIHPKHAPNVGEPSLTFLESKVADPRVVGVGEIGLDLWCPDNEWEAQRSVLQRVLKMKITTKVLIIHLRGNDDDMSRASQEMLKIMAKCRVRRGQRMHILCCYLSQQDVSLWASTYQQCYFGFSSTTTTFGEMHQRALRQVPLDRLLLESNAPELAFDQLALPNSPAYIGEVARAVADHRQEDLETIIRATTQNAIRLYGPL